MIRHIVMWKLTSPQDAGNVKAQLDSCKALVPGMLEFDVAVRTAGLAANCDVVLYAVFENPAALAAYQAHPRHIEVAAAVGLLVAQRTDIDYIL